MSGKLHILVTLLSGKHFTALFFFLYRRPVVLWKCFGRFGVEPCRESNHNFSVSQPVAKTVNNANNTGILNSYAESFPLHGMLL